MIFDVRELAPAKHVLSLGGGVQSTALLLLSAKGELPKLDACIFADTGWEPAAVYEHLKILREIAEGVDIRFITCGKPTIREDMLRSTVRSAKRWASMPLYTLGSDGKIGMIRRQCTQEYKIAHIRRAIRREVLGVERAKREHFVIQWIGISTDEASRISESGVRYVQNAFPLIGLEWNRSRCVRWLADNGFPSVPKSACIGCPFHTDYQWAQIKNNPAEWADACEFDKAIRRIGGPRGDLFLHRSCKPLALVNLDAADESMHLWNQECTGMCGV